MESLWIWILQEQPSQLQQQELIFRIFLGLTMNIILKVIKYVLTLNLAFLRHPMIIWRGIIKLQRHTQLQIFSKTFLKVDRDLPIISFYKMSAWWILRRKWSNWIQMQTTKSQLAMGRQLLLVEDRLSITSRVIPSLLTICSRLTRAQNLLWSAPQVLGTKTISRSRQHHQVEK